MHNIVIQVSATMGSKPVDAAGIAHWVGEALNSEDVRDSRMGLVIHSITVEEEDA